MAREDPTLWTGKTPATLTLVITGEWSRNKEQERVRPGAGADVREKGRLGGHNEGLA